MAGALLTVTSRLPRAFSPLRTWWVLVASVAALAPALSASANHIVMHGGPFGGVVVSLLPHPRERETLYVAAFGSGLYRSGDGGRRWLAASSGLEDFSVLALAMDPISPNVMYAGTDSGLFVSKDGGASWLRTGTAIADRNIRSLVVLPTRPTVLYAASDRGVLWSWDQGVTWAPRNAGLASRDIRVLRLDSATPTRLFAAGFGGVFRSSDEGRRWKTINRGLADLRVRALALDPAPPATLYAGTAGGGVFESTDGGDTWRAWNEGLNNLTVLSLLVTPEGERFAGTVGGVYRREPAAPAWERVGQDVLTLTITFVTDNPHRPGTVYAGTGGLVFVSHDRGRRWQELAVSVTNPAGQPVSAGVPQSTEAHSRTGRR